MVYLIATDMCSLARSVTTMLAILLAVPAAAAQSDACLRRSVPVTVTTNRNQPITSLTASDFKVSLRRKPIKILSATLDDSPRRILLVLDASGSMIASNQEWNSLLDVGVDLLNSTRDRDQAPLLVFSSHVETKVEFTSDRSSLIRALTDLRSRSHFDLKERRTTALWDALQEGIPLFGTLGSGDVLYIISDGDDRSSESRPAALETYTSRLRFFALIPGAEYDWTKIPEIPSTPDFVTASEPLERLVEKSGGAWVIRPSENPLFHGSESSYSRNSDQTTELWKSMKAFPEKVRTQIADVFAFQRLELELPEAVTPSAEWQLSLSGGAGKKGLSLAYPHELTPCEPTGPSALKSP